MINNKIISTVIPTFNRELYLKKAIKSTLAQTIKHEIIVCNHGGSDGTDKIIDGLYDAGEAACVSVHGGNRLGGNSLLDLIVFGRSAGLHIEESFKSGLKIDDPSSDDIDYVLRNLNRVNVSQSGENFVQVKKDLQKTMQMNFGVFRTEELMENGIKDVSDLRDKSQNIHLADKSSQFNTARVEAL